MKVVKVSGQSIPKAVAGALAAGLKENNYVEIHAIGASAVNQAVKAIAIARGFVAQNDIDLIAIHTFIKVNVNGEERSAIKFIVEPR